VESRGLNAAKIGIGEQKRKDKIQQYAPIKNEFAINNENNRLVSRDQLAKNIHPPPETKLLAATGREKVKKSVTPIERESQKRERVGGGGLVVQLFNSSRLPEQKMSLY
jgi:hypothetical protein